MDKIKELFEKDFHVKEIHDKGLTPEQIPYLTDSLTY